MHIRTTAVTLEEGEIARLIRILADGDNGDALCFVREVLEERVKAHERPCCVPVFDVGYNPGQDESFRMGH